MTTSVEVHSSNRNSPQTLYRDVPVFFFSFFCPLAILRLSLSFSLNDEEKFSFDFISSASNSNPSRCFIARTVKNDSVRPISCPRHRHSLAKGRVEFLRIRSWFRRFCCDLAAVHQHNDHQWRQVEADGHFLSFGISSSCSSITMMPNKNVHVFNARSVHLDECLFCSSNWIFFVMGSDVYNSVFVSCQW